ncbi:MAG: phosphatidylglycerol lysyltransferase domain-containing protein [Pseudomonadota bacterium]
MPVCHSLHFPWKVRTARVFAIVTAISVKMVADLKSSLPPASRSCCLSYEKFPMIGLMLWGQEQGYRSMDLGMAPLSGLDNRAFAPLWNRVGAVVFQHGEHFYNFEGLREYKQKFKPIWSPRYLACPGGLLALPHILVKISALISGGIKGVVAK